MYRLSGEVEFAFWSRTLSRSCTTFGPALSTRHGSRYISETRNGRAIAAEFNMTCTLVTNFRVRISRATRPGRSIDYQGVIGNLRNRHALPTHHSLEHRRFRLGGRGAAHPSGAQRR